MIGFKAMTRKKKLVLNTMAGLIKQFVTVICGFILPRYMLLYYGSATNGLVSSISHFLGFISLLDMGVGAVIQANLYSPLAKKDNNQLSKIIISSERFFRRLAMIFLGYIIVLIVLFPVIINNKYDTLFTVSLLLIIAFSTFAQYFFGMTYELLLNADQKSYVQLTMQIITIVLNTVGAVVLMKCGASIHVVKLMTSVVFLLRPIGQSIYVRKHYKIDRRITVIGEPIKQKWNGFSQHLASVICQNIDVVVLTTFSSLENVSIYSVYYLITNGVEQIIMTAATGLESMFGNMIANGEKQKLGNVFDIVEWAIHNVVTIIFTITALTIVPFVSVYTKEIHDINYILPLFGALMVLAYASECLRIPYFRVIKAAGHFRETQNGAYISAALNIVITVTLVFKFGLIGAAIGTLIAMLFHTCYLAHYLKKNILNRPMAYFIKYLCIDLFIVLISCNLCRLFIWQGNSYLEWVIYAIKVTAIVGVSTVVVNLLCMRKKMMQLVNYMKNNKLK